MRRVVVVMMGALLGSMARAETLPTPGPWRVDRVKLEVRAEPWGPACGPAPRGHDWKVAADEFELQVQDGELRFASRRRLVSSTGCEAQSPKTRRTDHQTRDGVRVTECAAPDIDGIPEEKLRHAFQLIDAEHVLYVTESSRLILPPAPPGEQPLGEVAGQELVWYSDGQSWKQGTRLEARQAQRCVLHLRREERLERAPATAGDCLRAGPPRRLELEPATADLAAGEHRCFQVIGRDLQGCPAELPPLRFSVAPVELASVDDQGCVLAAGALREAAAVALTAEAPGLRASALLRLTPTVAPPPRGVDAAASAVAAAPAPDLETLVRRSSSARVREVAAELVGAIRLGELSVRAASGAASPSARHAPVPVDTAAGWPLVALAAALLAAAGLAAVLWRRRVRRVRAVVQAAAEDPARKVYEAELAPAVALPTRGQGLVCPTCKFEFESGAFCPFDRSPLLPLDRDARHTLFIPVSGGMICPVCKTRYPAKARFCGKDRSPLIPDQG